MEDADFKELCQSVKEAGAMRRGKPKTSAEIFELEEKLEQIKNWCKAYPVKIFPEPDFKVVREALRPHNISLAAVSASNMRYVLKGIQEIIDGKRH